jgi:cathepsin A (carboxypeptidase C)
MIWLDQPAGVGFSWGTLDDKNEADAARDAYDFLQAFFKAHAELQARPFFIVGESYGGHYSPALSYLVSQNNANLPPGAVKINLQGLGVGNGLTVPLAQYPKYAQLAYNYTAEKLGKPVISLATCSLTRAPPNAPENRPTQHPLNLP